jgi:uncharacterized membrane protein
LTYVSTRYSYADETILHKAVSFFSTFTDSFALLLVLAYLLPLGFLIFDGMEFAVAGLFILVMNMASTNSGQHALLLQTTAGAIPYLFVAMIITLSKLKLHNYQMILLGCFMVGASLWIMVSPVSRIKALTLPNQHTEDINRILQMIPNGASVTTTNNIIPHLCSRTDAYIGEWDAEVPNLGNIQWGYPRIETQYILIDLTNDVGEVQWTKSIENGVPDYSLVSQVDGCKLYELRSDVK